MRRIIATALVAVSAGGLVACGSSSDAHMLQVSTGVLRKDINGSLEHQMNAQYQCMHTAQPLRGILEVRDGDHHLLVAKDLHPIATTTGDGDRCAKSTFSLPYAKLYNFKLSDGDASWTATPHRLKAAGWKITLFG